MDIQELWDQAKETGNSIDIDDTVVCDYCDEDYTESADHGGFIFGSKAICPKCAPNALASIEKYNEQRYIKAHAQHQQSFANFVREYRGPNATIQIIEI